MAYCSHLRETELAILNAPFEERGWERAVAGIAAATRSSGAHLLGMGGPLRLPLHVVVGNYSGYEHYFTDPALHGQCNWRVSSTAAPMGIQYEADYRAYRRGRATSDYDDAVSDLDIPYGCQSAMFLDANGMVGLALLRSSRDGPCSDDILRDFALLRHQLARSLRVQMALDSEAAELMVGDLDAVGGATILLDRHGNVCALTPAAEPLLDDQGPLRLDGLMLRLRDPRHDRDFGLALARLLASDGRRQALVHQARITRNGTCARVWRLAAVRLPHRPHGLGFDAQLAISLRAVA